MFYCEVDGPDWEFTWYRNKDELQEDQVVSLQTEDPYLNVTNVAKNHQGDYSCQVKMESRAVHSEFSNTINIEVYGE